MSIKNNDFKDEKEADRKRDEALLRALKMQPKRHKPVVKKPKAKKPRSGGGS